jgi:hypothetical protein
MLVGLAMAPPPSRAAEFPVNEGWVNDAVLSSSGGLSLGSAWSISLPSGGVLSIVDAGRLGDTYMVMDSTLGLLVTTTPGMIPDAFTFPPSDAVADALWEDEEYSKAQLALEPGDYELVFNGSGRSGFYFRVDAAAIPAPAALAVFAVGFTGLLVASRRRNL